MALSHLHKLLTLAASIFAISSTFLFANLEQKMLSINPSDKKVTLTFYHFDSSKSATLANVTENLGKTAEQNKSIAAIAASSQANFTYQSGNFNFPATTTYLIQNATIASPAASLRNNKYTFILTNHKGRHAICYAPAMTEAELGYALLQYLTHNNTKFTSAVIIDTGNQCSFFKSNDNYLPYYLKELKKPAKALIVK